MWPCIFGYILLSFSIFLNKIISQNKGVWDVKNCMGSLKYLRDFTWPPLLTKKEILGKEIENIHACILVNKATKIPTDSTSDGKVQFSLVQSPFFLNPEPQTEPLVQASKSSVQVWREAEPWTELWTLSLVVPDYVLRKLLGSVPQKPCFGGIMWKQGLQWFSYLLVRLEIVHPVDFKDWRAEFIVK
jgi:hypothetical protein